MTEEPDKEWNVEEILGINEHRSSGFTVELVAAIDAEVYRQCVQRAETIDEVCEMALAEGCSGVSVYQDVVFVDPDVPYGHIYQHQRRYGEIDNPITSGHGR